MKEYRRWMVRIIIQQYKFSECYRIYTLNVLNDVVFNRFNRNRKCEWSTDTCYNIHEYWKHPKTKSPYRIAHQDHTHLVCFKSIKVVKMRESLKNTSRKRILDQNGKRLSPWVRGNCWKWKWACGLDSNVENVSNSSLGGYMLVLQKN